MRWTLSVDGSSSFFSRPLFKEMSLVPGNSWRARPGSRYRYPLAPLFMGPPLLGNGRFLAFDPGPRLDLGGGGVRSYPSPLSLRFPW